MQVGAPSGWSLVLAAADTNRDQQGPREDRAAVRRAEGRDEDRTSTRDDGPRYPYGFFARYLRDYVFEKMDAEGWRQYQVAEWVGIADDALSVYLNRHAHPTPERRHLLTRLGCIEAEMIEAELLDKLHLWMRSHDASREDVLRFLDRIRQRDAQIATRRARQRAGALEAVAAVERDGDDA